MQSSSTTIEVEKAERDDGTSSSSRPPSGSFDVGQMRRREIGLALQAARRSARQRYELVALALKLEAGVKRHYTHRNISGIAWTSKGRILAPKGITRRQLYVLAHECGHLVLHRRPETWNKPGHIKEHEAETYAHRALHRYGIEVPAKSSRWARNYVAQWIAHDHALGLKICMEARAFAMGNRSPLDPLPAVDGHPAHDFSQRIERFIAKGSSIADEQERLGEGRVPHHNEVLGTLPNACATCWFFEPSGHKNWQNGRCEAFMTHAEASRLSDQYCKQGTSWRPHPNKLELYSYDRFDAATTVYSAPNTPEKPQEKNHTRGFMARLGDAIVDRISGRYRVPPLQEPSLIEAPDERPSRIKVADPKR